MAASLEDILSRLLVPDNAVLLQATQELRELYKDPTIVNHLYNCMCLSQHIQVRQYSAVLLRRKICKSKAWKKLPEESRQMLKQGILVQLLNEKEKPVVLAIVQIVAAVAKNEFLLAGWPELQQFFNQYIHSKNVEEHRLGFYTLSIVASVTPELFKPHLKQLLGHFVSCLQSTNDTQLAFYIVRSVSHLVCCLGTDDEHVFQTLIPFAMEVIKHLIQSDEDQACEALELFDELMESEIAILVPHIKPLMKMCLEIAANTNIGDRIRVRSLCLVSWIISLKKKTVIKHKMIGPILDVLFPIMGQCTTEGEPVDDDLEDDGDDDDENSQTPSMCAAQVIDVMALHLPPEKLISPLSSHVEQYLQSENPYYRKAAYLGIAVIAEGCSETIRHKHLKTFLQVICRGITDPHPFVKNSALFALGQFAEYLQPDVSSYASEILPILFTYLAETCQQIQRTGKDPPNLTRTFYALENFFETLEKDIQMYLPALMEQLLTFLSTQSVHAKELAISAIGAAANAAKELMLPYFHQIIEHLKIYLTEHQYGQNLHLRTQALDTLAVLARTIGTENFLPMAHDCMQLGLKLIETVDDPDLRRCVYGLFASLSSVLKEDMVKYLDTILGHMFSSLHSAEGFVAQINDTENEGFALFDDLEDSDEGEEEVTINDKEEEEEEEELDVDGYKVQNAYLEEKEDTCCALKEIACNVGVAFIPHLETSYTEVYAMIDYPSPDVRKASLSSLGQFLVILFHYATQTTSGDHIAEVLKVSNMLVPKLIQISRDDPEREVVIAALDTLSDLIKELKNAALDGTNNLDTVVNLIKDAFKHKLASQDSDSDDEGDEKEQAEYDEVLIESAGDIVPSLARAVPPEKFAPYLAGLLPFFKEKLKKQSSISERSYAMGVLAETVDGLGKEGMGRFCQHFLPIFLNGMKDSHEEVRSNAVFGLGVLVENSGELLFVQYPELLEALSAMLAKEDNRRAKDNLCGAVARLILTHVNGVPLKQVLPVLLQCLPLEEDFEENNPVFRCICYLYSLKHEEVVANLPRIIEIVIKVINTPQVSDDTRVTLVQLLKSAQADLPKEMEAIVGSLSPAEQELFAAAVSSS